MPVEGLQSTLDQFADSELQRKHAGQSGLVNTGKAVQAIAGTLQQIKQQKDEARAQSLLDSARQRKAELDLLLADKTVAEQEEVMASSRYADAYQDIMDQSAAVPGKLGDQVRQQVSSIQTKVKLGHLTNMAKQMGTERKERVKETLKKYKGRLAADPSKIGAAALDARASVQMFMQTPAQRKSFDDAMKRETLLGHLDAYTNNGPHHDAEEAKKILDDSRSGKYLSAAEIRRYRGYIKPKEGSDASNTTRNNIISGAIDLKDFRYLRNAQGDPKLSEQHKKQLNTLNGHIRSLAAKGEAPTTENMQKLLIANPADKSDRDWNKQVHSVGKALGELYADNPRDYMKAVMGGEFEAAVGHGDAVSAQIGSRVTNEESAKITQEGLKALMEGNFAAWDKQMDGKYGDNAYLVKKEAINRFYHKKHDLKSRQEAAALRTLTDPQTRGLFSASKVQAALNVEKPHFIPSAFVPAAIEKLKHTMTPEKFNDVVTTMQALAAQETTKRDLGAQSGPDFKAQYAAAYDEEMESQALRVQASLIDLQEYKTWWPDPKNGLLEEGRSIVMTPEFVGSHSRVELEANRKKVRRELNPTNVMRYNENFDKVTQDLLKNHEDAEMFIEPDPTSGGDRFLVGVKVPTGRTAAEGWVYDDPEMRTQYINTADGQQYKVSLEDVYGKGQLFPETFGATKGPESLTDQALNWLKSKTIGAAASTISPDAGTPAAEVVGDGLEPETPQEVVTPQLTPQQVDEIAPVANLPAQQMKNYEAEFKPAISTAVNTPEHVIGAPAKALPKKTLEKAMAVIASIESKMGTGTRNQQGLFVSDAGALGPFQILPRNAKGIDPHNMQQAAGRSVELFTRAYSAAKRHKHPKATELDYLVMAARIYNGGYSFNDSDTLDRIVRGVQSMDKTKNAKGEFTFENNNYAANFLRLWGSSKMLRYEPGMRRPK